MESVAFIACVNDEQLYRQSLVYLDALNKSNFSVEIIKVVSNYSLTSAYNEGMRRSKAHYKVYLHQDTFILEKDFLNRIDQVFKSNPSIGMIGVLGGRWLPFSNPRMLVWDCLEVYGGAYIPRLGRILWGKTPEKAFEWVTVIDGMLMITQYDLPWREDIINGFHFYDLSHSLEFWEKNLQVVVPRQEMPWCAHVCTINHNTDFYRLRDVFKQEYSRYLLNPSRKKNDRLWRVGGKIYRIK